MNKLNSLKKKTHDKKNVFLSFPYTLLQQHISQISKKKNECLILLDRRCQTLQFNKIVYIKTRSPHKKKKSEYI